MKRVAPRPAVFFDRDGVLNEDRGYVHRAEDLVWMPGVPAALERIRAEGYWIFVVTNQGGIARGYYSEDDVRRLHAHMQDVLGGAIDAFRYCPHYPDGEIASYSVSCRCRKPAPGMIESLMDEFAVTRVGSFLVGDRDTDLAAARAAGIPGHRFAGGSLDAFIAQLLRALAPSGGAPPTPPTR